MIAFSCACVRVCVSAHRYTNPVVQLRLECINVCSPRFCECPAQTSKRIDRVRLDLAAVSDILFHCGSRHTFPVQAWIGPRSFNNEGDSSWCISLAASTCRSGSWLTSLDLWTHRQLPASCLCRGPTMPFRVLIVPAVLVLHTVVHLPGKPLLSPLSLVGSSFPLLVLTNYFPPSPLRLPNIIFS